MSTCYIFNENGIKMSQKQLFDEIKNKILADPDLYPGLANALFSEDISQQAQTVDIIDNIRKNKKGKDYEGVSHFLDQKHSLADGKPAIYLAPQYIEENLIANYVRQNREEGKSPAMLEEEIRAQIKDTAIEKEIGTLQHALIQALFDNGGKITQQFKDVQKSILTHLNDTKNEDGVELDNGRNLRDIITQDNKDLKDTDIVKLLSDNAVKIYNSITSNPNYKNAKFYAECDLYGDDNIKTSDIKYKGIKGVADLIVVKEDGTVDIIDFKVCGRQYDSWCAAKQYHTEYQLGVYRQLLAQHGIDGSKVGLFIQPIYLNRNNAADTEVEQIQDVLASSAGSSPYSRLHWNYGRFTTNIKYLIPSQLNMSISEAIEINDQAMSTFHEMLDYNPIEKSYSKEELIDEKLHDYVENGKKVYTFYDRFERKLIKNSDRNFFTKDGGYIDKYLIALKNVRNTWTKSLYDAIEQYKSDPNKFDPESFDFLKTKGKGSIETIMNTVFGEFTKWYWKPMDMPVLLENGILGFYNIKTGSTSFVVVTDQSLSAKYKEGKFGSLLGNFYANDEVRNLDIDFVFPAECQYAELMKCMHIINSIADSNPEFFRDKTIGSIQVINPQFGENNSVPIKTLQSTYNILCEKTKTTNHFLDIVNVSDPWVDFGFQLEQIASIGSEQDAKLIKKFIKSHKANSNNKFNKINELIRIRKALEKNYPRYQVKDYTRNQYYNSNNPMDNLFVLVNELILYYQNIPIDPAGNFDKYGLNARSIMEILGLPFVSNIALGNRGVANGLFTTSAENSPSPTLRALSEYYQAAFAHVREEFTKQHNIIEKLTIPYISKFESQATRLLSGIGTKKWERLLVKDDKGNIAENLILINPYTDHSLDKETADFLKGILWEINKYRYKNQLVEYQDLTYLKDAHQIDLLIDSDDNIQKLIQSGQYFELPLKRARYFERWKKVGRVGLKDTLLQELDTLKDDWDLTNISTSHKSLMLQELRKSATTMYNQYNMSREDRDYLIKKEGISNFETDLDLLALDVAFQSIREDYFENVLQTTAACATMLHVNQALTGINRNPELEALDARDKSAIKNEGNISEEMKDTSKVVTALRKLNSVLVLAFRPLQLIKELTVGQFTNFSRALGTVGSSDKLTLKNIYKANTTIWGQSISKWAKAFTGNADIASYTLCESLNKIYGIANEDIARIVETSMASRHGVLSNLSKYMYLANSVPDYFNRLTLFVAKMMEDGCFEAHSLDKDGNLIYDFKKDKRFSELNKYGLNSNNKSEKYREQKGLYLAMLEQFQLEGRNYVDYDKDGNVIYKEFDRAYTSKQRNSIKEVADLAYGYYDHETKSLVDLGFFGLIYRQFQTFLTAKTNLWLKGRPSTKGDNTSQGHYEIVTINGEKCYRRLITKDNKVVDVKIIPESQLKPEEVGQLDYAYKWKGDYVEGLVYSIGMTLHDLFRLDFNSIKNNKYRLGNIGLALHDILIGVLLYQIFKWLFSGGTKKMQDIPPLQRTLVRAMQDVSPAAIAGMSWEPGFYSTVVNLRDIAVKLFTDDDPDVQQLLTRNIGAIRDWTYNNPE